MGLNLFLKKISKAANNFFLEKMDSNRRQKILNPISLRLGQIFFDLFARYPISTESPKSKITPFFIIGSGRSGTTLLRSVLMGHSLIDIPPESMGRIPNSVKKFYRYGGLEWKDLVNVILGEFSSFDTFHLWEIDLEPVRKTLYKLDTSERSLAKIFEIIYQRHITVHKPEAQYWGDKSPFNTLRLKWIDRVFPNAKYINLIRDGRDVVSSYLKAGLLPAEAACERWNSSLNSVEKFKSRGNEERVKTIYYEDFVKEPLKNVHSLCSFIGINFERQMLDHTKVELGDEHLEHMQNVKNPIDKRSIGKWKYNLSDAQKRIVLKKISPNLQKYGYI